MFKLRKFYVGNDVVDREALCKRLTDNGATLVSTLGEQDSIHVLNAFEGGVYEECVRKGWRIIGVPCLQETLQSGKALPRSQYPLYSRVMEGIVVSGDAEEKLRLKSYVDQMNGIWADEMADNIQYFIANEPGSIHYLWALEFGANIVQSSWITESWENCALSDFKSHLLPPLSGCIISVTGLSAETRTTIQQLVTHYGGKYTQQLSRKVTHLLCDKPTGRKYVTALSWGIHIVTSGWLFDSINAKGTVDVSRYELSSVPDIDGTDPLYSRSAYTRPSPYNPLSSRSRISNYSTPILVRRHRTPMGANYTPLFSIPSTNPHQPVFAQTTQIQSGSSHTAPLSHSSLRQQAALASQSSRYSSSTRSRDKEARSSGMDRYREMVDQLTGLVKMCDDLIEKSGVQFPHNLAASSHVGHFPNFNNSSLANSSILNYLHNPNIANLANLYNNLNNLCNSNTINNNNFTPNNTSLDINTIPNASNSKPRHTTTTTTTSTSSTDKPSNQSTATDDPPQPSNTPSTPIPSTTPSAAREEGPDIEMESDDDAVPATTTSSEQEK